MARSLGQGLLRLEQSARGAAAALLGANLGATAISQPVPSLPAPLDPGTARPLEPGVVLPALHGPAVVIQRVATTRLYVALTVDDFYTADYHRQTAIQLLRAVNALQAQLTLCPAGSALVAYTRHHPEQAATIKRLVAQGTYEFCDHTYSHPVMPKLGKHKGGRGGNRGDHPRCGGDPAVLRAGAEPALPAVVRQLGRLDSAGRGGGRLSAHHHLVGRQRRLRRPGATSPAARGQRRLRAAGRYYPAARQPAVKCCRPAVDDHPAAGKGLEPVGISTLLASGQPVVTNHPSAMRHLYTCTRPPAKLVPKRRASK